MITKLKAAGAYEVIQHGPTWQDADAYLRKEVMTKVSPTILTSTSALPYPHIGLHTMLKLALGW